MPQAPSPLFLTQVGRFPFSHFQSSSLWGNKNWAPQYKDVEVRKFREQKWPYRLQIVQFECPRHSNPHVSLRLGEFQFPIISRPLSCMGNKKWFIIGGWVKRWKTIGTKSVEQVANGPFLMLPGQKLLCLIHL